MNRILFLTLAFVAATATPLTLSAAEQTDVASCAEKTLDQYLGRSCEWAYWIFYFEQYTGTATGGAARISARNVTVAPTFYPNDHNFYGVTLTGHWSVNPGQSQKSKFVVWITPIPGETPLYFLNGMDGSQGFVPPTANASISARYTAYDGQGNAIPGANAFLYANTTGAVLQQAYTQVFPGGLVYPIVMELEISLAGNQGTASIDTFDFSVYPVPN
jgi:hypothetical protein